MVIGNPPYKEKAKGRGGWVESGNAVESAPLAAWMPPRSGGSGRTRSICVTCTYTSGAGQRGRCSTTTRTNGDRLLHHGGGLPQRTRLREDARLPPADDRRGLGDRLLAGGSPACGQHQDLRGRTATRVHRACVQVSGYRPGGASDGSLPIAPAGHRRDKFDALSESGPRHRWLDGVLDGVARSILAGGRSVVDVSGARRPVRLQRLRRDARPYLDNRPRC